MPRSLTAQIVDALAAQLAARSSNRDARTLAMQAARDAYETAAGPIVAEMRDAAVEGRMIDVLNGAAYLSAEIRDLHVAAYVIGRGGRWGEMTASDYAAVAATVERQVDYLIRWAESLIGTPPDAVPSQAAMMARAMLYAAAASESLAKGEASDAGVPVAMLPAWPTQGSECKVNCKCRWAIRTLSKARGDFDVSWRMGGGEHCRTCRRRAIAWKRVRIRGGVWADGEPERIDAGR